MPLFAEEVVAKQDQHGQGEHDQGEHVSRLSIRLHSGPVVAVADVGAVARFEACAPSRVHVARINGRRGDKRAQGEGGGVPLRYAGVVPAQNASGCTMPREPSESSRAFRTRNELAKMVA